MGFVVESVKMGWRWLIRMKTALILLGILAIQTAIATAVPQEPNVRSTVEAWRAGEEGPGVAVSRVLDAIGAYDVYGSALFLALLMLLFLSLTACLIPRIRAWVRLVRHSQPPLIRRVGAHDRVERFETGRSAGEVRAAAAELLEQNNWRTRTHEGEDTPGSPGPQVAAEKGLWSREGGSLLFHLSFYVLLAAIVFGQLLTFEGQVGVVEGERGFTDTEVAYWNYQPGRWFGPEQHTGWQMQLDAFEVDWVRDPGAPGAGQPTTFRSAVTLTDGQGEMEQAVIEGNAPHTIDGFKIHQLDWGYAARVVIEVDGEVVHDDFLTLIAMDVAGFRGAAKAPAADPDVGLDLILYPYAPDNEGGEPIPTGAPWDDEPLLIVSQHRGDLQLGATQQSIVELDTSQLELEGGRLMRLGDTGQIEDVTISFPELRRWVGFQVSTRPQIPWLLFGSALLVAGLFPALYAYRRRLWVVATPSEDGTRTLVRVSGRAFQRPERFEEEHADLVEALAEATDATPPSAAPPPSVPDPDLPRTDLPDTTSEVVRR